MVDMAPMPTRGSLLLKRVQDATNKGNKSGHFTGKVLKNGSLKEDDSP